MQAATCLLSLYRSHCSRLDGEEAMKPSGIRSMLTVLRKCVLEWAVAVALAEDEQMERKPTKRKGLLLLVEDLQLEMLCIHCK